MIIIDLVLVLVLGLECLVLVLVLGLEGQVLVNITGVGDVWGLDHPALTIWDLCKFGEITAHSCSRK